MSGEESFDKLIEICSNSNNFDEIFESLDKLRELQVSEKVTLIQRLEAQLQAFENIRILMENTKDTNISEKAILDYLLPGCLLLDEPGEYLIYRHRGILRDWFNDLIDIDRDNIRTKVIEKILPLLNSPAPKPVCWTISSIGYKDPRLVKSLWKLAQDNDNEIGDIALSTITWLGVTKEEEGKILQELHTRVSRRYNHQLSWGIARIGDPSSVMVILNHWLLPEERLKNRVDTAIAFTALREIADVNDDNHLLQDLIWTETAKLVEQDSKALYWNFDIGHIVVSCNSPIVVPTILTWHRQHSDWFEDPGWARYMAQDRLKNCVKPRQLDGWLQYNDKSIFDLLRNDACMDTKYDDYASTVKTTIKEIAWKTLLCAGYEEALSWFNAAVANEGGRFIRQKVMKYLACFQVNPLPDTLVKWIVEPYNDPGTDDSREMSYRMAAVRVAESTATEEALEHLLNFGFTYKSRVITGSSDAVADVALSLIQQGNTAVIKRIASTMLESSSSRQQLVCANTLEVIATFSEYQKYLLPYTDALILLVRDEKCDDIVRGLLLNMLGHLTEWIVPEQLLKDLVSWAHRPDKWVGGGSLQILASHDQLEEFPRLMNDILALEKEGDNWRLISDEIRFEWAPYIIGFLYHKSPQTYTSAVMSLLKTLDWHIVVQVIRWLIVTCNDQSQSNISQEIIEALIHRIYSKQSLFYSETEVFDVLSRLSPHSLIEHSWDKIVNKWMPDARIALANALGKAQTSKDNLGRCLATLEMLVEDSFYPVRRVAYRGLSKQSATYLYRLCQSWLESPLLRLKLRAVEGCGWVENVKTEEGQDGFEVLYQKCTSHPEPSIREAIRRSWEERRKRLWARDYLSRVMSVDGKDNGEILRTWCYGDALCQIGDDECRDMLREYVSKKILRPNVRYWIENIIDELEINWKKTTQKWPEPWTDMSGAIERGNGKLISGTNEVVDIQYSTWWVPAASPEDINNWGGTVISSFKHFLGMDKAVIELQGERRGEIILTGFLQNIATFLGTGPYPK